MGTLRIVCPNCEATHLTNDPLELGRFWDHGLHCRFCGGNLKEGKESLDEMRDNIFANRYQREKNKIQREWCKNIELGKSPCVLCGRPDHRGTECPHYPSDEKKTKRLKERVLMRISTHIANHETCPICGENSEHVEHVLRCLNCGLVYGDEKR